ncbi:tRNA (adenosine(37)-N6)-threonylcarbamoyltransferase complex ATPase subunit type 1 TsaE [Georgenia sp. Z1344]|uniref:tRNA (adenosine(37)-N6)-threonylcarbamoyltransferase complex ATPase subunit type 1 TsaE n=1 Tax=Georgenia sp. Z1344 TaxID=3416706 RepID=UPI003CF1D439
MTGRTGDTGQVGQYRRTGQAEVAGRGGQARQVSATWRATAPTAEDTRALAARLAAHLRAGDLLVLTGPLGAGKTTFVQGLGAALGVRGTIASPTFVIAREHVGQGGGPGLVHVDAYRLAGAGDLDALDLDSSLEESVTVVEWGEGTAEALAESRLDVVLTRPVGDVAGEAEDSAASEEDDQETDLAPPADEPRTIDITAHGPRWAGTDLSDVTGPG